MYSLEQAARWLEEHPNFAPVFHEGRVEFYGKISLIGFREESQNILIVEVDFPHLFKNES